MTDQGAPTPPVYVAPPAPAPVLVAGRRSTLAAAAGVILIVLGVIGGVLAAAILTIGRGVIAGLDFSNLPGMQDVEGIQDPEAFIGGVFGFIGILLLVFSLLYVLGGIGALRTAGWGRVIGIVIGIIGTLFWLPAIAGASGVGDADPVIAYVLLAAHVFTFVALAFFWRAKPSLA